MRRGKTRRGDRALHAAGLVLLLCAAGCGGARPYRAMARAATSEESIVGQVEDERLKLRVREALLPQGFEPRVTPYVYMGRVFLVGTVSSPQRAEQAQAIARGVEGAQSVDAYLPVKTGSGLQRTASDVG